MCYFIPMPAKSMHYYLYFDIGPGLKLMNAINGIRYQNPFAFYKYKYEGSSKYPFKCTSS